MRIKHWDWPFHHSFEACTRWFLANPLDFHPIFIFPKKYFSLRVVVRGWRFVWPTWSWWTHKFLSPTTLTHPKKNRNQSYPHLRRCLFTFRFYRWIVTNDGCDRKTFDLHDILKMIRKKMIFHSMGLSLWVEFVMKKESRSRITSNHQQHRNFRIIIS